MDSIVFNKLDNGNFHPFGMLTTRQVTPSEMRKAVEDYNNNPNSTGYLYFGFKGCVMYSRDKPIRLGHDG